MFFESTVGICCISEACGGGNVGILVDVVLFEIAAKRVNPSGDSNII